MKNNTYEFSLWKQELSKREQVYICDNIEAICDCLHIIRDFWDEIPSDVKDNYLCGLSEKYMNKLFKKMDKLEAKILDL